jgi:hypothetical protein
MSESPLGRVTVAKFWGICYQKDQAAHLTRLFQNEFQLSLDKQSRWGSPLGYMQGHCITVLRQDMSQTPSGGVGTVNFCGIGYQKDQAAKLKSIFLNWIWLSLDKQSRWGSPRGHTKRWCNLHLEVDRSQTTYWRVGMALASCKQ